MENSTDSAASIRDQARTKLPDFLLAEYEHMVESLLRNEELGEKRAAFFVTLVGGAGGVLGFILDENTPIVSLDRIPILAAGLAAILLCLGVLTVRRLIERDIVTDKYKFALRALRVLFLSREEAAGLANAFFDPYGPPSGRPVNAYSIQKGGWLHTVAFVNSLLTGVIAAGLAVWWHVARPWQIVITLAGGIIVWIAQLTYGGRKIAANHAKLAVAEPWMKDPSTPR